MSARSPFPVEITGVPEDRRLPIAVEAAIYYVISESLANAARHAAASSARVTLSCSAEQVTVEIADDGLGGASLEAGSGLRGLVDRVEALGGELILSSPHRAGTLVRAEPLRDPAPGVPIPVKADCGCLNDVDRGFVGAGVRPRFRRRNGRPRDGRAPRRGVRPDSRTRRRVVARDGPADSTSSGAEQ